MNVLLAGPGGMGSTHYHNYAEIPGARVTALVGASPADREAAARWGLPIYGTITEAARAELLVILTDCDGLYTADPRTHPDAQLLHTVPRLTREVLEMAGAAGSSLGTGGMTTKLHAAQIATHAGMDVVISNGSRPEDLYSIIAGEPVGTRFLKMEV